jgi:hypothetical protein
MIYAANISSSPFGINVHLAENDILQKVMDAGIKWIRIDLFWSEMEPAQGVYDFSRVDRVVEFAHQNDLSVLAIFESTPDWANDGKGPNYPADDIASWQHFITTIVKRYQDRVKYWNIWNEPNVPEFFRGGKEVFLEEVFLPGAEAIKNADSSALIVGPELAHLVSAGKEWSLWLRYLLNNAGDYIDVISHHIYESQAIELLFKKLEGGEIINGIEFPSVNQIVRETGNQYKPFWVTETGWDTWSFSEQKQAEFYLEMLQTRDEKRYPDKIFFYEIIDSSEEGIPPWGILKEALEEKPAYTAYSDFISGENPDSDSDSTCFLEELINSEINLKGGRALLNRFRQYRDEVLMPSGKGMEIVKLYYSLEKQLSRLFQSSPVLRKTIARLVRDIGHWLPEPGKKVFSPLQICENCVYKGALCI